MPPPCGHEPPKPGCHLCDLAERDPRYKAAFAGLALPPATVRRPLPCVHLGRLVMGAGCLCPRSDVRHCDHGHGAVSQARQCEVCPDYEADEGA